MAHNFIKAVATIMFTALVVSCSNDGDGQLSPNDLKKFEPISFSRAESDAVARTQNFGWNLLRAVDKQEPGNFMISPLSAVMNLSMLANGAGGETQSQILEALEISSGDVNDLNSYSSKLIGGLSSADNSTDVQIANALFVKSDINVRDNLKNNLKQWYDADVLQIGTGKSGQINQWVANKTNKRITYLISPTEEESTNFALANALYFDAIWQSPFSESATIQDVFRAANRYYKTAFMCKTTYVDVKQNEDFAMARLNFGNGAFSIYFILPLENVQLDDILPTIDDTLLASLTSESLNLNLRIPKFKLESQINLIEPLKQCGITDAFDILAADFSNLMDMPTNISHMRQGCVFSIDEKGVKAAAATYSKDETLAPPIVNNGDFFLDKPFIFLIRENNSNACLFMGKVEEP